MQPTAPDILTREIPLPSVEHIALSDRHLHSTYQPLLQQQIQALAMAQSHIEALTATCQQQAEQISALKARVQEHESEKTDAAINGAVRDLVSGGKKAT